MFLLLHMIPFMSDKPEKSEHIMAFVHNSNGVQVQSLSILDCWPLQSFSRLILTSCDFLYACVGWFV